LSLKVENTNVGTRNTKTVTEDSVEDKDKGTKYTKTVSEETSEEKKPGWLEWIGLGLPIASQAIKLYKAATRAPDPKETAARVEGMKIDNTIRQEKAVLENKLAEEKARVDVRAAEIENQIKEVTAIKARRDAGLETIDAKEQLIAAKEQVIDAQQRESSLLRQQLSHRQELLPSISSSKTPTALPSPIVMSAQPPAVASAVALVPVPLQQKNLLVIKPNAPAKVESQELKEEETKEKQDSGQANVGITTVEIGTTVLVKALMATTTGMYTVGTVITGYGIWKIYSYVADRRIIAKDARVLGMLQQEDCGNPADLKKFKEEVEVARVRRSVFRETEADYRRCFHMKV
jgi:hypothetical protein